MAKGNKDVPVSRGTLERMPRPLGDIDRVFEDFFNRGWLRPFKEARGLLPSVDVIDREDEVLVRAAVPGYKKDDIEVSVSDSTLILKGETKSEQKEEKGEYYCSEISQGSFYRMVDLPTPVNDEKAKATMKDGMLELTLPKSEKSKRRSISISS